MGAQCGRERCEGVHRLGEALADDLLKDEAITDLDGTAVSTTVKSQSKSSTSGMHQATPPISFPSTDVPARSPKVPRQWQTDQLDGMSSDDDYPSSSSAHGVLMRQLSPGSLPGSFSVEDASPSQRASSQRPSKNSRMFLTAPARTSESTSATSEVAHGQVKWASRASYTSCESQASSMSRIRWTKAGKQVNSAVRLTKLLRASNHDVPPLKCAISLDKLNIFAASAKETMGAEYAAASFRAIVEGIIQPQCDQSGKAYARALNDEAPCAGHVFVCHCWDGRFDVFVESINDVFRHWPRKPNLWISGFALVQSRRRIPFSRPLDAPFAAVLKAAHAILIVQSEQDDLAKRIWPIWEIYLASKFGVLEKKGGLLFAGPRGGAAEVDCQRALSSNLGDKAAIDLAIVVEGGHAFVDEIVAKVLRRAAG